MLVWYYFSFIKGKIFYIHLFTGEKTDKEYVVVDKSLVRYGNISGKQLFQGHDEKIFIGDKEQVELKYIFKYIINGIFDNKFALPFKEFEFDL